MQVTKVRSELHVPLPPLAALPDFERQTLESAHNRRLSDIIYNHARKALNTVTSHKWSWPFNAPVDTNIYKDYLEKVQTPMDFGSIKRKMEAKEYTHPDALLTDVRLVFDNAKAYNKPGSDVHVMAITLAEKFEEKYTSAVAGRVTEENTVAEAEAMAARRRYAGAAAAAGGPQRDAAVAIVMHHHPGLQPFEEVAFDLDMLDALTLRQLISFIEAAEAATAGDGTGGGKGDGKGDGSKQGGDLRVQWPDIPVGSGIRHFAGKKKKRTASGGKGGGAGASATAAAVDRATTPASEPGTTETTPALEHETPANPIGAGLAPASNGNGTGPSSKLLVPDGKAIQKSK